MSITEQRERLRRARAELEPLVKEDYRVNAILNAITKLEAELSGLTLNTNFSEYLDFVMDAAVRNLNK